MIASSSLLERAGRVRLVSITAGVVLGMAAGAWLPDTAHAAEPAQQVAAVSKKAKAKAGKTRKSKSRAAAAAAAIAATPVLAHLPEAMADQMAAAERVLFGRYECEFGKTLLIDRNDKNPGYINLTLAKDSWVMKPVQSSTGAIRLEDVRGHILLLQILTKSMLMNVRSGQRMVDGCVHEVQRAAVEDLQRNPQPAFLQ